MSMAPGDSLTRRAPTAPGLMTPKDPSMRKVAYGRYVRRRMNGGARQVSVSTLGD
jgi:hypothetical protein